MIREKFTIQKTPFDLSVNMSEVRKIPYRLQLKDSHPTAVKLSKLMDLASELGIIISFLHQRVLIQDKDRDENLPPLYLEDIEEGHWFDSFPIETEYKLVYVNPEYLANQKKEEAERIAKQEESRRLAEQREYEAAKKEMERRAKVIEDNERRQLAILKEKYES